MFFAQTGVVIHLGVFLYEYRYRMFVLGLRHDFKESTYQSSINFPWEKQLSFLVPCYIRKIPAEEPRSGLEMMPASRLDWIASQKKGDDLHKPNLLGALNYSRKFPNRLLGCCAVPRTSFRQLNPNASAPLATRARRAKPEISKAAE